MRTVKLRRDIKKAIDRLPAERLSSLADYVDFLTRPALEQRLTAAEKAIASGKGANCVHPGTRSLRGALASKKGKGMSFAQIREAAAAAARKERK